MKGSVSKGISGTWLLSGVWAEAAEASVAANSRAAVAKPAAWARPPPWPIRRLALETGRFPQSPSLA